MNTITQDSPATSAAAARQPPAQVPDLVTYGDLHNLSINPEHGRDDITDFVNTRHAAKVAELHRTIDELQAQMDDFNDAARWTMDERCDASEKHCTCVPLLRQTVKELTAERDALKKEVETLRGRHGIMLDAWTDQQVRDNADRAALAKELAELRAAAVRKDIDWHALAVDFETQQEATAQITTASSVPERHRLSATVPIPPMPVSAPADDWIPWSGGKCPVPKDTMVEYKMRSVPPKIISGTYKAKNLLWTQNGDPGDIVFYRVVKAAETKPAPVDAEQPPNIPHGWKLNPKSDYGGFVRGGKRWDAPSRQWVGGWSDDHNCAGVNDLPGIIIVPEQPAPPTPPEGMVLLPDAEKKGQWIEGAKYWSTVSRKWRRCGNVGTRAFPEDHIAVPAPVPVERVTHDTIERDYLLEEQADRIKPAAPPPRVPLTPGDVLSAWRECAERLALFASAYRSHPLRNPADKLEAALTQLEQLKGKNP